MAGLYGLFHDIHTQRIDEAPQPEHDSTHMARPGNSPEETAYTLGGALAILGAQWMRGGDRDAWGTGPRCAHVSVSNGGVAVRPVDLSPPALTVLARPCALTRQRAGVA